MICIGTYVYMLTAVEKSLLVLQLTCTAGCQQENHLIVFVSDTCGTELAVVWSIDLETHEYLDGFDRGTNEKSKMMKCTRTEVPIGLKTTLSEILQPLFCLKYTLSNVSVFDSI